MFRKIKCMALKKNFDLKTISTIHIGGKAKYFVKCYSISALKKVIKICEKRQMYYKIIGGGSNLLFDDNGFDGVIIKYCEKSWYIKNNFLTASAGMEITNLIAIAKANNLSNLENFVGIPCTLGGAIFNNLGANNIDISTLLINVQTIKVCRKTHKKINNKKKFNLSNNLTKNIIKNTKKLFNNKISIKIKKYSHKILKNSFSYRKNNFLKKNEIIIFATIKLQELNKNIIQKNILKNHQKKYNSQPLDCYSAGSVFKRGQDFLPAKIIDNMGLKGMQIGNAQISTKHAGFIINLGNATCNDTLALIDFIKQQANKNFGKIFEEEIEYVSPQRKTKTQ